MRRPRVARQPREGAVAEPDAKACVQAASRIEHTTAAPDPERAGPSETPIATTEASATEAEILLGTAMWLARTRDWLAEEIDLAPRTGSGSSDTVALPRADLEALRNGLGQAAALLDQLTVDPSQIRTSPGAMPSTTGRTLQ